MTARRHTLHFQLLYVQVIASNRPWCTQINEVMLFTIIGWMLLFLIDLV